MPIKVCWTDNGPFALCDTPAEAAELLRAVTGMEKLPTSQTPKASTERSASAGSVLPTEEQTMGKFLSELKPLHKNFLAALAHSPEGIDGERLASEVGMRARQFGAVVGAISKNAKRNNIRIAQLMLSEARFEGARRYRFFQPRALLQRHAGKIAAQQELRLAG